MNREIGVGISHKLCLFLIGILEHDVDAEEIQVLIEKSSSGIG